MVQQHGHTGCYIVTKVLFTKSRLLHTSLFLEHSFQRLQEANAYSCFRSQAEADLFYGAWSKDNLVWEEALKEDLKNKFNSRYEMNEYFEWKGKGNEKETTTNYWSLGYSGPSCDLWAMWQKCLLNELPHCILTCLYHLEHATTPRIHCVPWGLSFIKFMAKSPLISDFMQPSVWIFSEPPRPDLGSLSLFLGPPRL